MVQDLLNSGTDGHNATSRLGSSGTSAGAILNTSGNVSVTSTGASGSHGDSFSQMSIIKYLKLLIDIIFIYYYRELKIVKFKAINFYTLSIIK